jgi:hypothetical protein
MFGRREKKDKGMEAKNALPVIRETRENPATVGRD